MVSGLAFGITAMPRVAADVIEHEDAGCDVALVARQVEFRPGAVMRQTPGVIFRLH
jgi:hypothetical protein